MPIEASGTDVRKHRGPGGRRGREGGSESEAAAGRGETVAGRKDALMIEARMLEECARHHRDAGR